MPKLDFDGTLDLGYIMEGTLRKNKKGVWFVEKYDGTLERLEDALEGYKNKEVRLSVVSLREADHLQNLLSRRYQDGENGNGESS